MSKWTKLDANAAEYRKLKAEAETQKELVETQPELTEARLIHLENTIKCGLETFMDVGAALLEIRDKQLYRPKYKTFELYCRERWKVSRIHAYRLIESSKVASNLLPVGNIQPQTESQVRPLTGLPEKAQRKVWEEAVQSADGKQPTAKQVEAARDKKKRKPKPDKKKQAAERLPELEQQQAERIEQIHALFYWGTLSQDQRERFRNKLRSGVDVWKGT